ncbi:DUF4198 domain-containing protein [Pseudomonas sp. TTU2014-080ASC]|uniref:DUF4198 domain-containing protein n=1 Tax=Pseudomonas sp. TTU2014-080ASC TaxID=1729724 RepID=UPI00071893F2|nr:DUF4198 domain-containing protein [Pseudomonas sp. TTU2014-080ASC]KRW62789.1 ABC transporter permease [Pseudomonas sp. TTU2014-080ASC]
MNPLIKWTALTLAVCLPLTANAHRAWMLPSATVLSGDDAWVTVDAAVSNDLFYFEHFPLRIQGIGQVDNTPAGGPPGMRPRPAAVLQLIAPDGSAAKAENGSIGRYRSTFDLHLEQKGTYKLAIANHGLFASYKENGETRRWMGKAEDFAKEIPAKAEDLKVTQNSSRMEVFVTSGNPTETALKTTGKGLELAPITHPNDLFEGEAAEFQLLLDGKPAKGVEVSVIPGGNRYRSELGEIKTTSDADGKISITWPNAGMYWLEAEYSAKEGAVKPATEVRASYSATLEVLPQ